MPPAGRRVGVGPRALGRRDGRDLIGRAAGGPQDDVAEEVLRRAGERRPGDGHAATGGDHGGDADVGGRVDDAVRAVERHRARVAGAADRDLRQRHLLVGAVALVGDRPVEVEPAAGDVLVRRRGRGRAARAGAHRLDVEREVHLLRQHARPHEVAAHVVGVARPRIGYQGRPLPGTGGSRVVGERAGDRPQAQHQGGDGDDDGAPHVPAPHVPAPHVSAPPSAGGTSLLTSVAWMIRRWRALPFGWQVVRVSVASSGVLATTSSCLGDTGNGSLLIS